MGMSPAVKPSQSTDHQNPIDHALRLASLGFRVFRLRPNSKAAFEGWQAEATDNVNQIKALWRMTPDAGVGLAMGNGLVAVDLDKKPDRDGLQSLCAYLQISEFELLEMTRAHLTPSGGRHLIFRCDGSFGNSVNLLNGVDVRGEGGYIAGPGTVLDGATYTVESDVSAQHLPATLSQLLHQSRERDSQAQVELFELDTAMALSRAKEFLQRRAPAIEGQGGDEHTYVTALEVRDLCVSEEKCVELMLKHWNERCDPPWDPDDIKVTIGNAYRYAKERPGNKGGVSDKFDDSEYFTKDNDGADSETPRPRFLPRSEAVQANSPEPSWQIENVIPEKSIGLLYGPESCYKGFITLDVCLSAASNIPWAAGDRHSGFKPARRLSVLYIAGEGVIGVEKQRRPAWKQARKVNGEVPFYTIGEMPRLTVTSDVESLVNAIKHSSSPCKRPDLIIVDTVVLAMAGTDENSAKDTGYLISACRLLIREFGCTVLLIHHTGKDAAKGARGSYNLQASCDFRYRVRVVDHSHDRPVIALINEKQKDADLLPLMMFEGRKVADSLVFDRASSVKTPGGILTDTVEIVREALGSIPKGVEKSASEIARHVVNGNLTPDNEATFKKRIQRDVKDENNRRSYGSLIRENDKGVIVFIGQQERDEETGLIDAPDI